MDAFILVKAHTDPVRGTNYTPESLTTSVEGLLRSRMNHYIDSVELVSESDVLHTDSIPLAEFEYLKSHSPLELITKLRDNLEGKRVVVVDDLLHEAVLMISALNAVKVVGEAAKPMPDGPNNPRSWEGMGS